MKSIDEMLDAVAKNLHTAAPTTNVHITKSSSAISENEPVKIKPIPHYDSLTLSFAKEIAYAVETAAKAIGVNVVIALRDAGANLILLHAMDDSYIASVSVAQDKAYTAAALKMPTHEALAASRGGALDGLTNGNGIMLLGGGEPLKANGTIYGAVGVSGGTKEQDILLAELGNKYFQARIK